MSVQALLSQGKVETPVVFKPETVRPRFNQMPRKSVLVVKDSGTSVSVHTTQLFCLVLEVPGHIGNLHLAHGGSVQSR